MSTVAIKNPQLGVHIRWMIRRDMDDVLAIERASYDHPWCEEGFLKILRQRNCIGMVAEHCDKVVGFFIYELRKDRIVVMNLAVDPNHCRGGTGRQLIAKLVGKLSDKRNRIDIVVRETNLAAQLFLRECGFRAHRVLRGEYEDTGEDGYAMTYKQTEYGR